MSQHLFEKINTMVYGTGTGIQPGDVPNPYLVKPPIYSPTDQSVQDERDSERDRQMLGAITKYGLSLGAMVAVKKVLENEKVQRELRNQIELTYLDESIRNSGKSALDIFGGRLTLTNMAMEAMRRVEELSPFSILRTFQMSHFMQPFASGKAEFEITQEMIASSGNYYEELIRKYGKKPASIWDMQQGYDVKGGKLYNKAGDVILENVRGVATEYGGDTHETGRSYVNRILRRFVSQDEGISSKSMNKLFDMDKHEHMSRMTIIAGESENDIFKKWFKAAAGAGAAQGFTMVNEPLGFIEEMGNAVFGEKQGPIRTFLSKIKINPEATRDSSILDLTKGYVKHGATKTLIGLGGLYALDNASKLLGPQNTGFEQGIVEGLATTYAKTKLAYAQTVGDSFSEYKEEQEYVAPKSTNLLNLAGLPLAGAMLGGTIAYGQRLFETSRTKGGYEEALRSAQSLDAVISPQVSKAVASTPVDGAIGVAARGRRYATRGALAGALLALPFIPGALIGDSSEQVLSEYWGDEKVAIKSTRGWFSGSGEFEGQGIKYFAHNWYQRIMANSKDKVLYGNQDTKEDLSPFLSPFDYLRNPYRFEEMHKDDMPYPVWGMDVSYGGWAGKIFERTLGQIIKPDIINPEMYKLQAQSQSIQDGVIQYAQDLGVSVGGTLTAPDIAIQTPQGTASIVPSDMTQISVPVTERKRDQELIQEGLMSQQRNLSYDPNAEAAQYTYNAALDFIGLKGWALGMVGDEFGVMSEDYSNQLARSGESTNIAKEFMSYNAGGLFGAADVLRRIIPMSSDAMYDRANPLQNNVAPSWLPGDASGYFNNFSRGNYYDSVERGYERLPGVGMEQYRPDIKGVNPEDYSDIDKFRVLSDVAYSSSEYYNMAEYMKQKYSKGEMSEEEMRQYAEVYDQNQQRAQKKNFYEYRTDEELEDVSAWGKIQNAIWEGVTHNAELPTENLTFFRPAGKLLHQRTAIEDYRKTQILGSDMAMWDKPYEHFIRPFINESIGIIDGDYIPVETQEKRNVESYFDSLEYYKQMQIYRENVGKNDFLANQAKQKAGKTIRGAIASGLDDEKEILGAYSSLSSEEKAYFTSFVNAHEEDRSTIAGMLDENTSEMYQMLWRRKDAAEAGRSIEAIVEDEEQDLIARNSGAYRSYRASGDDAKGITFSEYLQEGYARAQIEEATGMPDESFIGWDARIDVKDVKLRTLMIGAEDVRGYGFWERDEADLLRQIGVLNEDQVTTQINAIKTTNAQNRFVQQSRIKDELHRNGIDASSISFSNVGMGDFNLNLS